MSDGIERAAQRIQQRHTPDMVTEGGHDVLVFCAWCDHAWSPCPDVKDARVILDATKQAITNIADIIQLIESFELGGRLDLEVITKRAEAALACLQGDEPTLHMRFVGQIYCGATSQRVNTDARYSDDTACPACGQAVPGQGDEPHA